MPVNSQASTTGPPEGSVTILFTDVVGSTLLWEQDAQRMRVAMAHHDKVSRRAVESAGGTVVKMMGDGMHAAFDDPHAAVAAALGLQQALTDSPIASHLRVRCGLHLGVVERRDSDVFGTVVNRAARIMGIARGGQILLSGEVAASIGERLPSSGWLQGHGHYRLKGVEEPVGIFEVGTGERTNAAVPEDTDKAYRVVRSGDLWRPVREIRHSLPAERDSFIGRISELRALAARLDAGARLVTVLGPGGTGKTRFVRRFGWTSLGDWPGGVYFCDLSEAKSLDGILVAVAVALGVPLGKDDPVVQIGHVIAARNRCLVILDNFEQVLSHAGATVGRWVDRAGEAAFVVTSRERLHLAGEELFPLAPLPIEREAIELFAARAKAQRPDFVVGATNRAAVTEVVRLLDGLPLAIELAAARVRVLSPAQLVERMRDRFRLLAGTTGAAARQATLRAAIDWSWDLLAPWEQDALAQCSIFEGGFTLEAAEAVLDLSPWPDAPLPIDAVQALADKSLLRTWVPAGRYEVDEPFFGMYFSIREYAAEKLRARGSGAEQAAAERHGRYFAGFGTDAALEALSRHGGVKQRRVLALELDNLVAACRRAASRGDGATAVAAYRAAWEVLDMQGPFAFGAALGAEVLAVEGLDAAERAAVLLTRGLASRRAGRGEEAALALEQALALYRDARDRRGEGHVLITLGNLRRDQGKMSEARDHLEAALAIVRAVGERRHEGNVLGNLGNLHAEQGRMDEARAHYQQALAIHREVGNRRIEGIDLSNLGNVCREQGRIDEGRTHYEQALAIHREVGNRRDEAIVLGNLGLVHADHGRAAEAQTLYEAALAIAREVGDRRYEGYVLGNLGNALRDQGRMDEARAFCDQALAVHRAVGNRRSEGTVLGSLGDLLLRQGRLAEAREALRTGEALLREIGDRHGLAMLLCIRGLAEVASGDHEGARAALAAAEDEAAAIGAVAQSELYHEIGRLRDALLAQGLQQSP